MNEETPKRTPKKKAVRNPETQKPSPAPSPTSNRARKPAAVDIQAVEIQAADSKKTPARPKAAKASASAAPAVTEAKKKTMAGGHSTTPTKAIARERKPAAEDPKPRSASGRKKATEEPPVSKTRALPAMPAKPSVPSTPATQAVPEGKAKVPARTRTVGARKKAAVEVTAPRRQRAAAKEAPTAATAPKSGRAAMGGAEGGSEGTSDPAASVTSFSRLTEDELQRFNSGRNFRLYEKLGSHPGVSPDGEPGTYFSVWAPDARAVSLIGDWNRWQARVDPLARLGESGVWATFVPGVGPGARYKYRIESRFSEYKADKADPIAFSAQVPPEQASVVSGLAYEWQDADWMSGRKAKNGLDAPISIYEVHLGSWRRIPSEEGGEPRPMTYREIAPALADYAVEMGYTHVELLPVMEHPFYGSWGYQVTGYFAATSRYGSPQDLMFLIDTLHQRGIGVLLDWVPSHFPTDEFGLGYFDGTYLYEHADPRQGFHPDWGSLIFNYGRHEVKSFLISSALFWLDVYHADGLRVDAVASMLYRDYSREEGAWVPNIHGGRENLEAIDFLHTLNREIAERFPDTLSIAEESTAWPLVSRPVEDGGLGFDMKWDMGWMHDTLKYFALDPLARSHHHGLLTFRAMYAGSENFVLPLSHDEVVHMKGSLVGKMPGDLWQKFANLRLLFAFMLSQPGKKLLFMGGELGQWREWNHDTSLDWHLLDDPLHAGLHAFVRDVNHLYLGEPALHELDAQPALGFEWLACDDAARSVLAILRKPADPDGEPVAIVLNFTPVPREDYSVGLPQGGLWREILNGDDVAYGGTGIGNPEGVEAEEEPLGPWEWSLKMTLPPLSAVVLKRDPSVEPKRKPKPAAEESEEPQEIQETEEKQESESSEPEVESEALEPEDDPLLDEEPTTV